MMIGKPKLTRSKATRYLTYAAGLAAAIQAVIEPTAVTTLVFSTLISGFTIWKQALSIEIKDNAIKATIFATILMFAGAANDFFDIVDLSTINENLEDYMRKGIAILIFAINMFSKDLFPTPQAKEIEELKSQLVQEKIEQKQVLQFK